MELVGRVREALGGALPGAVAAMRAYLPNPSTHAILFKPIKSNVAEAHGQVGGCSQLGRGSRGRVTLVWSTRLDGRGCWAHTRKSGRQECGVPASSSGLVRPCCAAPDSTGRPLLPALLPGADCGAAGSRVSA